MCVFRLVLILAVKFLRSWQLALTKIRPTCVFERRPSRLKLTSWNCAEVNIYSHLQALANDIFIRADYAFSALETMFRVLSNSNSNRLRNFLNVVYLTTWSPGLPVYLISGHPSIMRSRNDSSSINDAPSTTGAGSATSDGHVVVSVINDTRSNADLTRQVFRSPVRVC